MQGFYPKILTPSQTASRTHMGQGFQNEGSHLTIPRKGMETIELFTIDAHLMIVALNYSPQGDGNR